MPTPYEAFARLAILACCPWTQAKRVQGGIGTLFPDPGQPWPAAIVKILSDRRPNWATDWINLQLDDVESNWGVLLKWTEVLELVKSGVIARPVSSGYIQLMEFASYDLDETMIDQEVIDCDIWRMFEVQTGVFAELPPVKKIDRAAWANKMCDPPHREGDALVGGGGWPRVIYYLATNEQIDRRRLLQTILDSFWKDFNSPTYSGLVRFHELIAAADDELADFESSYRELLCRGQGPVVGLAIRTLGRLHKAKRLDVEAFLQAVPGVFAVATKTQPMKALTLIDKVAKSATDHAVVAVSAGLNHDSPEIQEKAIKILAKWKKTDKSLDLSSALESASLVAPQNRRALEALAGSGVTASEGELSTSYQAAGLDSRAATLRNRIECLPNWILKPCCLTNVKQSLEKGDLPPVFDPPVGTCPVLSGVEPIEAIRDIDELIDVVMHVLTVGGQPEDEERVVDAVLRLGHEQVDNFQAKTDALRNTLLTQLEDASWMGESGSWAVFGLQLIVGRWLTLPQVSLFQQPQEPTANNRFFTKLLQLVGLPSIEQIVGKAASSDHWMSPLDWKYLELFQRLERGEFGPVLSTPTHKSGWLDARVFVDRLIESQRLDLPLGKRDFIGGLLRLAPDCRREALNTAGCLLGPYGPIVRYALGGPERPGQHDLDQVDEWLAAGRARDSQGRLTDLIVLGIDEQEPDAVTPASYSVTLDQDPDDLRYTTWCDHDERKFVQLAPKAVPRTPGFRPTVTMALGVVDGMLLGLPEEMKQYQVASSCPLNTDPMLAAAANRLFIRLDDRASTLEPTIGLMSSLLERDRPWTAMALVTLWLGMLSRDDQARGIAVDAMIDGIADGRADSDRLSETLLSLAGCEWVKLNRLTNSLREVSGTSRLAERIVSEMLDRLIGSWPELPRDGHYVLSLQVELLASLETSLSDRAASVLSRVKGSSKAAKLSQRLCALKETNATSSESLSTVMEAIEGRLARAERILRNLGTTALAAHEPSSQSQENAVPG